MKIKTIMGFAAGPVAGAVLGLMTVPLTAWAFSPEDVGRLNLLQVLLSFSSLLLVLGLDQAYVREYHGSNERARLLKACFAPGFLLLLVAVIVTFQFAGSLSSLIFGEANFWYYALTIICVAATYISRFLSLILRMQERGLAYSMSQIIPKALQLLLLGLVVLLSFERNFLTLLGILTASFVAVVLTFAWNTRRQWLHAISTQSSATELRNLLKFGFPLVFSGLAYWGLTATSTLMLRSHSILSELGVYSVTVSFAGAAAIFQSIFTVIWAPTVYKWAANGVDMARVDTVSRQALMIICAIFALTGILSWLTDYILPVHYIDVKHLLLCAIMPPLLYTLSEITSVGIGISRRTVLTVWITLAALITNVLLSLWLVPIRGAGGAVIANAISYMVYFIARTEVSASVWRQFPRTKLYLSVALMVLLAVGSVIFSPLSPVYFPVIFLMMAPLLFFCFREECFDLLLFLKDRKRSV